MKYQVADLDPTLGRPVVSLRPTGSISAAGEFFPEPEKGHLAGVRAPSLLHFVVAEPHGGAVLVCPGGGYQILSVTKEGSFVAGWLNSLGFHAFVLKYRLGDHRHPAQLQDAARALRLVRARAADWDLHPSKIGAIGFSAGGHLVSMLSTLFARPEAREGDELDRVSARPDWAALIYPLISSDPAIAHASSFRLLLGDDADTDAAHAISTERQVDRSTPPSFLLHARDDRVVPFENAVRYDAALRSDGVSSTLHLLDEGGHGFGLGGPPFSAPDWRPLLAAWFEAQKLAPAR